MTLSRVLEQQRRRRASPHNMTDARQDQGWVFFRGAHPQKTFATRVNVAKLELSGLNEAKLQLYASVSSLDL